MPYRSKLRDISECIENAKQNSYFNESIKLVAVSKTVTSSEVAKLYNAGCAAFGENRVQSLKEKCEELSALPIEWHFIGRLQTNKINQLIALRPALIHSCDSLKLALEIDKRLKTLDQTIEALLQINSAKEATKAGVEPKNAMDVYKEIIHTCQHLKLKGVMSIGAHTDDIGVIQKSFETTREIYELALPFGAKYCSMGMSSDFELAIRCGANIVRLGSVLFK